jgi:hypothetical protein
LHNGLTRLDTVPRAETRSAETLPVDLLLHPIPDKARRMLQDALKCMQSLSHRPRASVDPASRKGEWLDIYSHVLPGLQEDAAKKLDFTLRLAIEKRQAATRAVGGSSKLSF